VTEAREAGDHARNHISDHNQFFSLKGISNLVAGRDLFACLIVCLVATLVLTPIYLRGFPAGTDVGFHFRWVNEFSEAWREPGVWYPRWLGTANNGQGSPVLFYYPPLSIFVAGALKILVGDTLRALSLSCWLALTLSGLTMYAFSRSILSHWPSLIAALFYVLAPYHLFVLYHGSSMAEFWSFVWLPLLFHMTSRVAQEGSWGSIGCLGIIYALLLMTHLPASFLATLFLPFYVLLLTREFSRLFAIGAGLCLGLALAAVFLAPVVFERDYVNIAALLRFAYPSFFLFQHVNEAFATRLLLPETPADDFVEDIKANSYVYLLKTEQVAVGILVLVIISAVILMRSALTRPMFKCALHRAVTLITVLALVMTTFLAKGVWRLIPQLPLLQFPSRFLVIATATSCLFVAVTATSAARYKFGILWVTPIAAAVAFNLLLSAFVIIRMPLDEEALNATVLRREVPEYRTFWWDGKLHEDETLPSVVTVSGTADIQAQDDRGINQAYLVSAATSSELRFRTLYFPGWTARVDSRPIETVPSEQGRILIRIEQGQHEVKLNLEDTGPRAAGRAISTAWLVILIAGFAVAIRRKVMSDP